VTERATLLLRRRRPIGEPTDAPAAAIAGITVLDGTGGAGRLAGALVELGVQPADVRQGVLDPEAPVELLDIAELGDRFRLVVLGSHLVNLPDDHRRVAFLGLAARHLAPGGRLLVEHHPLDWAATAGEVRAVPGGRLGMVDIRVDPPFVSAVSVYDIGGHQVRQPFTARVLDDAELDVALATAGLRRVRRLAPTWLEASAGSGARAGTPERRQRCSVAPPGGDVNRGV
jgi:hypothetical protein